MIHPRCLKPTIKRLARLALVPVMICLLSTPTIGQTTPTLNKGKKWRIGYYEGGGYSSYIETMGALLEGLMARGWIKKQPLPEIEGYEEKPFLAWLSEKAGDFLTFAPEDAYSAHWNDAVREKTRAKILQKLKSGSLDLMIAMGTWAGQDLANNQHNTPIVVLSTSDPVKAGIIKSAEDSGFDHVTARVDPERYRRQLRLFHLIARFKKLGVAFQDTPTGRTYSAMDDIEQVSSEKGFDVVKCTVQETNVSRDVADESCRKCFQQLSERADAVYVTGLNCLPDNIEKYVEVLSAHKVPSFSQAGSRWVEKGLLLGISSESGYEKLGSYYAGKIAAILNGAKPRDLSQVLAEPLDISINLDTARKIDFPVPESLLRIAREVYDQ